MQSSYSLLQVTRCCCRSVLTLEAHHRLADRRPSRVSVPAPGAKSFRSRCDPVELRLGILDRKERTSSSAPFAVVVVNEQLHRRPLFSRRPSARTESTDRSMLPLLCSLSVHSSRYCGCGGRITHLELRMWWSVGTVSTALASFRFWFLFRRGPSRDQACGFFVAARFTPGNQLRCSSDQAY